MLSLEDDAAIEAALHQPLPPDLHAMLASRLSLARSARLQNLTHVVVVQPGDETENLTALLGFSPLVGPIGEGPFGSRLFTPYWAWLEDLGGYYEMIVTVGDGGFAHLLLIEKAHGVPSLLLRMCLVHAGEGRS